MNYSFIIQPVPASRPRVTKRGVFYGKRYTAFKKEIAPLIASKNFDMVESGAIAVTTQFFIQMPKSWSKKKKEAMNNTYHIAKPDIDNFNKAIYDALSGYAWGDDCQIAVSHSLKKWAYEPEIIVVVEKLS